ncbi:MAG: hypothetical protein CMJ58_15560 [Planctomycetaceae bacterium]|nr:hypothetical protein [Planctomycetaceae bacterium]
MPRFVLLRHETPTGAPRPSHWDFMCERNGELATWAIEQLPTAWAARLGMSVPDVANCTVPALPLPAHRLAYLDCEGPVSGNRGHVTRSDGGEYEVIAWEPGEVQLELHGERLAGRVNLTRDDPAADTWRLCVGAQDG